MSEAQPESIVYAEPGAAAAAFQGIRTSRAPFTEVIWRLREAIEAAEFWILQEVNSQMLLKRGGYAAAPVRQLMFFHPRFMVRILEVDPAAMLEVPLKMAVLELPGGTVQLRWDDPIAAFARYGNAQLLGLGHEFGAACQEIAEASLRQNGKTPA